MFKYKFANILLCVMALTACNTIPDDRQIIPVDPTSGEATVLLTEFTGLQCVNCPLAANQARQLLTTYGDKLVVVAMHPASNPFTKASAQYDYTAKEADDYYQYFGGTSSTPFPTGVINFSKTGDNYFTDYTTWGAAIAKQSLKSSPATMQLQAVIDAATRQLDVNCTALFNTTSSGNERIVLWLVENNIIGAQMMPDGSTDTNYTHNHVFRQALNGTWGSTGEEASVSTAIPDNYNLNNLCVVAVLLDSDRKVIAAKQVQPQILTTQQFTLSVNGIGEITHDTTITITDIEENIFTGKPQMGIDGVLAFDGTLYVDIQREDTNVDDQFCCADKCINSDGERIQQLDFNVKGISSWFTHLTPEETKDYTITYTFNSHSTKPLRLTVVYSAIIN